MMREFVKTYTSLYKEHEDTLNKSSVPLLNQQRSNAMERFDQMGFPDNKREDYRHLDLTAVLEVDYGMNLKRFNIPSNPHDVFRCDVPNLTTKLMFSVNDQFYPNEKPLNLPQGVLCGSLAELSKTHEALLAPYFNQLAEQSLDGLVHFNTAFAQDGFLLYVPENVILDKPLQLIQILQGPEEMLVQRRLLVIMEKGSQAQLLLCDHTLSPNRFLVNQVSELFVADNARLEYYELEMSHAATTRLSHTFASVGASANLSQNGMTLSNGLTRNNIEVHLNGSNSEANLSGLALVENEQFVDNHIWVDHAVPHCVSNQLYKYVLDDQSKGVFSGRILVQQDAQKTAAYQSNRNLCMSKESKMFTKPQLEIYADDVRCSHGSATGQMDETAMFYIRSRGIPEKEARLLMKFAFAADVIDHIHLDPLKDRMRMLVEKRFRGELARCAGCTAAQCS
ncbi:MAG: Fe-S cluster assembly protein SufD [Bacteroidales bacterium]